MSDHSQNSTKNQVKKINPDLIEERTEIDITGDQAAATKIIALRNQIEKIGKQENAESVEKSVVDELNKRHAAIHTDRFFILTEKKDPILGGMNFTLESRQSFKDFYENQIVETKPGRKLSKATIWLKSPLRKQYEAIVFEPDLKNCDAKYYNIWKGLAVAPKKGCCEKYKSHVKDVICGSKPEYFNYVWKWIARLMQQPHKLAETAIILGGGQGTGKNTFVNPLGQIFGGHYLPLDNIEQLWVSLNKRH